MSLNDFEGHPVYASGIEMPGASGGLNKALRVNDLELHHGDKGTIAISYEVTKVRFDPVRDTEGLERVHVLTVTGAAEIPDDMVAEALEQQAIRVEEAKGVKRLPLDSDDPDADEPDAAD
jgi:hypothetical protein